MAVNGYDDLSAYGWGRALLEDERIRFGDDGNDEALPRYIDPLNDWGFKRLFGTEMNKEFLVAFLTEIFPDKRIKNITYLPTEQLGLAAGDRNARFDVMCRDESGELMTDKLRFVFIEIGRFDKASEELKTNLDKWFYVLKNLHRLLERPAALVDRIFKRFFEAAEVISLTKDEKKQYVSNMINERDTYNQIAYAREFGREEGIEQGKVAEREAIALRLIEANTPMDIIVKCTGLDKAAVEALAQKN